MRALFSIILLVLAIKALPQINRAEYTIDNTSLGFGQGISLTVPVNSGDVEITGEIPVSSLTPGFHQIFFRVRDITEGWSHNVSRIFLKSWQVEPVTAFRYRIDAITGGEAWTYKVFSPPTNDVTADLDINVSTLPDGIHYLEASARSADGVWSHITRGTFFVHLNEPGSITALEYFFEDEDGIKSPLLKVNDFTPSPNITLDEATFAIPVSSMTNLKKYFIYVKAVDETGNRGFFMKDTIVYHANATVIRDRIFLTPELMVFPNPAVDIVNIKLVNLDQQGEISIKIFDETGRMISEEKISFIERDHYSLDISRLGKGAYSLIIYSSAGRSVARATFIKQ
jgi:hypothetical protein